MAEWFSLEAGALDDLATTMEQYGAGAGQIVDDVLHGQGAQLIKDRIAPLIPSSGRNWKGKGRPASAAMPASFRQDDEPQAVTVAARGNNIKILCLENTTICIFRTTDLTRYATQETCSL